MRVLVCGGRDYNDRDRMFMILKTLFGDQDIVIVHGAAPGADTLAGEVAIEMGWEIEEHPADWNMYGQSAGPIRNQEMLDSGIDVVIALPGGRGTADMVRRATEADHLVLEIS